MYEKVNPMHPDKIADYISSYLLDRHLERDPRTRFAVEVMVKDQIVTLGGEIASEADFSDDEITQFCTLKFGTEFPQFAKIDVNGETADPLFAYLATEKPLISQDVPVPQSQEEGMAAQNAAAAPGLFSDEEIVLDEILSSDVDNLTPMAALQLVSRWKKALSGR
mgnify:CR=1 FL=1